MSAAGEMSFLGLIAGATLVVKLVLLLLVAASVYSWAIIFSKLRILSAARQGTDQFEEAFLAGGDLANLFRSVQSQAGTQGMANLFAMGFREFARLRQQGVNAADELVEAARRAMKAAQLKEIDRLERNLATLATVGSISPYIGLFGTVWGIMHAFISLGGVEQATLAMVAPGIAEALIATAIGLLAAIPAVVAYNRFADQTSRLELRYDAFIEEFSTVLQRHASRLAASASVSSTSG
jgi:biopolymer transport protein TolQ